MKTNLTMNVKDGGVMCECANCDWRGPLDECEAVENLGQRIAPGEICPAGECPECGALAHLVETEDDENPGPDLRDAVIDALEWFDNKGMINGCSFDEKSVRDRLAECLEKEGKRRDAPAAARELMEALAECWTHEGAPALAHPDIEFCRRRLRAINEIVAGAEKTVLSISADKPAISAAAAEALEAAESFISGFEGDEMQEGIPELLYKIRAARGLPISAADRDPLISVLSEFLAAWGPAHDNDEAIEGSEAVDYLSDMLEKVRAIIAQPQDPVYVCAHLEGGILQGLSSNRPEKLCGVKFVLLDYDDEGAEDDELFLVQYVDGESTDAVGGELTVEHTSVDIAATLRNIENGGGFEESARAQGWDHGGDGDGIIFHKPTWGSWKSALSWAGSDQEPNSPDAKPAIYSTWAECWQAEINQ